MEEDGAMLGLEIAERRIRKAFDCGDTAVDLSGLGLISVPESVVRLVGLTHLNLSRNRLTELPNEIGQLTRLESISLHSNKLTGLPESVERLVHLERLWLASNELSVLPESIGTLGRLSRIDLADNQLTVMPESFWRLVTMTRLGLRRNRLTNLPEQIGQLTGLRHLDLSNNLLTSLPSSVGSLFQLTDLELNDNMLAVLPESIGELANLNYLSLTNNELTKLPESVGRLARLTMLPLGGNPLEVPPKAVAGQGAKTVLEFMRARSRNALPQWRSKIMLVGEGGAGKTTLFKVMSGSVADPQEKTTHGLNIQDWELAHPTKIDVTMQLSVWDFGGQHVYHSTHQFFLTDQSLFLLVWNARAGWERARGRYWLDMIVARTGGENRGAAPVILVATHSRDRTPDLPLSELRQDYPNIVGSVEVDSLAEVDAGIDNLRQLVATEAAALPLMGSRWPAAWIKAAQAVRHFGRSHAGIEVFDELLTNAGVTDKSSRRSLTETLHRLGWILHYDADPELSDTVVTDPAWLSERIAAILDCEPVARRHGLLLAEDIAREWTNMSKELRAQLMFMMDHFDVSYRIVDSGDGARAIVVDRLPWEPPDYHQDWQAAMGIQGARELRLHYTIAGTVPPGIPGWFIARAHQFADSRHRPWRTGVLLAHPDGRHAGLLRLDEQSRTVELAVRGPQPATFLGVLSLEFAQATMRRYPGLPIAMTVPCPCEPRCTNRWPFDKITALHERGQDAVQCIESGQMVSIGLLIDGIPVTRYKAEDIPQVMAVLARIEEEVVQTRMAVLEHDRWVRDDAEIGHLEFAQLMTWIKTAVPTVFTITEKRLHVPGSHRYVLRLYCAEPGAFHQLADDAGCYEISALDKWAGALLGRLTVIAGLLSAVTGLTGTVLGRAAPELLARNKDDLEKLQGTLDHLKAVTKTAGKHQVVSNLPTAPATSDANTRKIEELLNEMDPHKNWGGLVKTTTPGGLTLFLCEDHARAYHAASPRPRGL